VFAGSLREPPSLWAWGLWGRGRLRVPAVSLFTASAEILFVRPRACEDCWAICGWAVRSAADMFQTIEQVPGGNLSGIVGVERKVETLNSTDLKAKLRL